MRIGLGVARRCILAGLWAACVAIPAGWQPALAQADFAGKTVQVIMPFSEGGGTDTWARIIMPHLAKKLPGNPTIAIRNMPGGGAVLGANYFQQHAKPDGLMLLATSTSLSLSYVLDPQNRRMRITPEKWIAVLASPIGNVIYSTTKMDIKDAASLKKVAAKEDLRIGVSSATGSDVRTLLSMHMLGINLKPVFGLDGGEAHLAFERGEVHVGRDSAAGFQLMMQPLVKTGRSIPLFTMGFEDGSGQIVRDPTFPDIPHFLEVYQSLIGKEPSGPEKEAWLSFFYIGIMNSKQLVLPPGTPAEIVAAYDKAVKAMVDDPEFQQAAMAEIGKYPQLIGEQARASMAKAQTMNPETRAWIANWLKKEYNTDL